MRISLGNFFATLLAVMLLAAPAFAQTPPAAAPPPPPPPPEAFDELPAKQPAWIAGYRVRYAIRAIGELDKQTAQSIITRIPTGGWLKPDASDVVAQNAAGQVIPVNVLSHDPQGDTIVQFKRSGNDRWYWVYGVNPGATAPKAEPIREGLVAEFRQWAGDKLDSWPAVLEGLQKSDNVIGNNLTPEIVQNCNPAKPDDPRKFAASYRGFLDIKTAGAYRFFVNSEDASFLFIDGFKVIERLGQNDPINGRIPLRTFGTAIELTAGIHPIEVHHVMGNRPSASGKCSLIWLAAESNKWGFVPRAAFVQAVHGQVADVQEAGGAPIATLNYAIADTLISGDMRVYLTRFTAQGNIKDGNALQWSFGDGVTGTGANPWHVYFSGGVFKASLKSVDGLPPFTRRVCVWPVPGQTNPLSLARVVRALSASNWKQLDVARINEAFTFLLASEQPERWPLIEAMGRHILTLPDQDAQFRAMVTAGVIEAIGEQGRAREAVKLVEPALQEFAKLPALQVTVKLAAANVYHRQLKDIVEASKLYESIIEQNRRVEHPDIRRAAVRWGDMMAETGDLARAAEIYRMAMTLGGESFAGSSTDAVTRGATLRVIEQRLRGGEIRQSRFLLEKIELQFPDQKTEGLYSFLKAETDRVGGRYEEAERNYEFILRLPQWSSYRDRAMFGLADANARMGNYTRALEWLNALKTGGPAFFESQKLDDYQRDITMRVARRRAATQRATVDKPAADKPGVSGGSGPAPSAASALPPTDLPIPLRLNFEPDDNVATDPPGTPRVVRAPGIMGNHVGLLDNFPTYRGYFDFKLPVSNMPRNGLYWVEFYLRENLELAPVTGGVHLHITLYANDNTTNPSLGTNTIYFDRTYGQWRRIGFLFRAPVHMPDGYLFFTLRQFYGVAEIDGITMEPVTDRQYDSMLSFIEGPDAQ